MSRKKSSCVRSQDEGFCSMEAGPSSRDDNAFSFNISQRQSQSLSNHSSAESPENQLVSNRSAFSQDYESLNAYAGIIMKLTLKNFMCHAHLSFEFNPKTNFIIGKNGSGKSAIQTAICIALGAKASMTNRAASLKKLIKTGCSTCSIELVLNNLGERSYKPNVYGNKIVVSRTLSESGSNTFRMKSDKGAVISCKKDDLENMLSCLQIQISNPISILNQDSARTFFSSTDAVKKYKLFLQATQIDEMRYLITEICNNRRAIEEHIKIRETEKETLEAEIAELAHKVAVLDRVQNYRNKKDSLEEEFIWAKVHKCRSDIKEHEANLRNQTMQVENLQETIAQKSVMEQNIRQKIEELQKIVEEHTNKIKEYNDSCHQARDNYRNLRRTFASKSHELESLNRDLAKKKTDLTDVQDGILRLESLATQNNDKLVEMKRKRENLEEKFKNLNLTVQEADREKTVLRDTENNLRNRSSHVTESIEHLEREKTNLNHQLSNLKGAGDTLNIYAPFMQQLKERIDEACARGLFKKRPKGPLGQYVKVTDAAWGPAVESLIGLGTLKGFLVDNSSDNALLLKIMNEVCKGQKRPEIYCSSFNNKIYDKVYRNDVKHQNYHSVFRALEISDPDVANSLIDNKAIETVLLIDDVDIICNLLENVQTVPKNCSRCINKFADTFYPAPSFRQYDGLDPKKNHRSQLLEVSITEARNSMKESIQDIDDKIASHQADLGKLQQELYECRLQMKSWSDLANATKKEISEVRKEMNSLEEETDSEEYRLPILKDEAQSFKIEINVLESNRNILEEELTVFKTNLENARKEYQQLQKPSANGDELDIPKQLDTKKDQLKETLAEKKNLSNRMAESTQRISFIENKIRSCQQEEENKKKAAEAVCKERETRDLLTIEQDYKEVNNYIDKVQTMMGASMGEMRISLNHKKDGNTKLEKGLIKLKHLCERYRWLTESRKRLFTRMVDVKSADVQIQFQSVLRVRQYKGRLTIDHKNREIKIMVIPTDGGTRSVDTSSLSGGERSYSAVAFIMALWKATDIPFYSMDEFDVFMDKVNRGFIIELLKLTAKEKAKCQFIFLTPQDTSTVTPSDELSIFQMTDPERTQNTSTV